IAFKGLPLELGALLDDLGNLAGIPVDHRRVSFSGSDSGSVTHSRCNWASLRSIIELALPCTRFRLGQLQCPHSRRFPRDPALPIPAPAKSKFLARVLRPSHYRQ